jgi:hypothetical protein
MGLALVVTCLQRSPVSVSLEHPFGLQTVPTGVSVEPVQDFPIERTPSANLSISGQRTGLIFAVLLLAGVSLLIWQSIRLSPAQRLEREALLAAKKLGALKSGKPWKSPSLVVDGIRRKADESRYESICSQNLSNLSKQGNLLERSFQVQGGTNTWLAFARDNDTGHTT